MVTLTSTAHLPAQCQPKARFSIVTMLKRAAELRRTRQTLAHLTPAQLEDIGLSVADATREARRPLWDAPAHWSR